MHLYDEDDYTCIDCGCETIDSGGRCDECADAFKRDVQALNADLKDDPVNPYEER